MGLFARLFSARGKAQALYERGMEKARKEDFQGAVADYTAIVESPKFPPDLKAMALFNRALAWTFLKDTAKAVSDLEAVLALPGAPSNVLSATKERLNRLKRRPGE
jgi:hypothetical protein